MFSTAAILFVFVFWRLDRAALAAVRHKLLKLHKTTWVFFFFLLANIYNKVIIMPNILQPEAESLYFLQLSLHLLLFTMAARQGLGGNIVLTQPSI